MTTMEKIENKETKAKASDHDTYGVTTTVSLLIPLAGIILGVIYLAKDTKVDRKLGEHLIAVGVLASIIFTGLWVIVAPRVLHTAVPTYVAPTTLEAGPATPTWDVDASYAKVAKGMTREAVEAAIGKTAANCSEVEQSGSADRHASCTYGGVGDGGMMIVNYVNDIVTTTEKIKY